MGKDISKAKTKKANDASVIAAKQNITKTYTVFGDWDATATTSGKAWYNGQILDDFEDKADFGIDIASELLGDDEKPLALSKRQVVDCMDAIEGDTDDAQERRADYIWSQHQRLRPRVQVAAASSSIDANIEGLADKLAPVIGADLDKGWDSAKIVRYIAAELAYQIQSVMSPDEMAMVPDVTRRKPAKGADNDNEKYNISYRSKIKGIDRGPPSWIGDLYDKMPDIANIKLGQSVLKAMNAIDPECLGQAAVKDKGVRGKLAALYTQRKNGIKNMTDAFRLIQRMELLNKFKLSTGEASIECAFTTDDGGKVSVQNLSPIRIVQYKIENKKRVLADVGFYPVTALFNMWNIENMPLTTAANHVVNSKRPRDTTVQPIDKAEEAIQVFKRLANYFDPNGSRIGGKRTEFEISLLKTQTQGDDAGLPADQELVSRALWLARLLAPHLPVLEAMNAAISEKDQDKRSALIQQNEKMIAALKNGNKAT